MILLLSGSRLRQGKPTGDAGIRNTPISQVWEKLIKISILLIILPILPYLHSVKKNAIAGCDANEGQI